MKVESVKNYHPERMQCSCIGHFFHVQREYEEKIKNISSFWIFYLHIISVQSEWGKKWERNECIYIHTHTHIYIYTFILYRHASEDKPKNEVSFMKTASA